MEDERPSLRHLRIFEAVARLRSVHKAAEAVHLSQPAVTLAVKKLEAQIGEQLFERRNTGSYLSPAGRILARRVGQMFVQIENALSGFLEEGTYESSLPVLLDRVTRPQIRILVEIAGGRSFAEAATRIGISLGSIHRSLRELESNLGGPIVEGGPQGLRLNRVGAELATTLMLALRELDWAAEEIKASSDRSRDHLRVGVRPLAGNFLIAPVIIELKAFFPRARVQVRTGDGNHLTTSLRRGDIDFIVGLIGKPNDLVHEALVTSPYLVVARSGHPLSSKTGITIDDLLAQQWIAPLPGATRRAAFDGIFKQAGREPEADIETYSLSTIQLLLRASDRLTLMTEFEYEFECGRGAGFLTVLPYGPIEPTHTVGVTRRTKNDPTPLQLKFLELIRERAASITNASRTSESTFGMDFNLHQTFTAEI